MSALPPTSAPKGRNKPAQGKLAASVALGHEPQKTSSPEGAKAVSEIPFGWKVSKLAELLTVVRGVSYKKEHASREAALDRVPILRATNIQNGLVLEDFVHVPRHYVSDEQLLRHGDIVIAASSGSRNLVGKAAQLTTEWFGSFGTFCFGLRPKPGVHPSYLAWFLQTSEYRHQVSELSAGVNINNLRASHIQEIRIPVPPLLKQRQILAEIEKQFTRLEAGVTALRRVQANLKRYRAAVLKAACEGRLVPTESELAKTEKRKATFETGEVLLARILTDRRQNWQGRAQYKIPSVIDGAALPSLPSGWAWASMRQVGEVQLGRQRAPQHHTGDNMRPYLRVANVFEARIDTRDVKEMNFTPAEFERYRLRHGDILLNEGQTPELVGRPAMFRDDVAECCYQKTLLRFRAYDGVLPQFALTVFRAYMHNQRFTRAASITTNIAHLTAEKFVEIEFPLPPLAEQTRIVAEVERRLSVVEELEAVVSANLQRATRLRQSILQKAFAGKL